MLNEQDWLIGKPIAHRGAHDAQIPENSLEAFAKAVRQHHAIELDVQLTKDKQIVVFHDYDTKRMLGCNMKISEATLPELKEYNLKASRCKIPAFLEVLELVDAKTPLLIEIKNEQAPGELEILLCEMLAGYGGRYAVQSFNPFVLREIRSINPRMIRGQLSSDYRYNQSIPFLKKFLLKNFLLNFISKPDFIAYDIRALPSKQISLFRAKGMPVIGWTVKTQKDCEIAEAYCDNYIFE